MSNFITRAVDGLQNVVAGLGTWRDKHSHSQYGGTVSLSYDQRLLTTLFRDSWLAKKIVSSVSEDMVREWMTVSVKDLEDFDFCELEKPWKLKEITKDCLCWARLFGGSAIIIGTKNSSLELELGEIGKDQLSFLRVVDRYQLIPDTQINEDIESPNFDFPEYYLLQPSNLKIHWTRVIRFEGESLPRDVWLENNRWGDSVLQHTLDSVKGYDSIKSSIITMFYEANVDILKVDSLTEMLATKGGEEKVIKRFQTAALMKSFNRVFLIGKDEEYEKKSNSFANLAEIWHRFCSDVAGASEIPMVRLFGETPGGLAATGKGELVNYYDMVSNKQETELKPQLEKLAKIIVVNAYGVAYDFELEFNPLWQVSEAELATVQKTRADRDKIYYDIGVVQPADIATELLNDGIYSSLTQQSIDFLKELEEPIENEDPEPVIQNPNEELENVH